MISWQKACNYEIDMKEMNCRGNVIALFASVSTFADDDAAVLPWEKSAHVIERAWISHLKGFSTKSQTSRDVSLRFPWKINMNCVWELLALALSSPGRLDGTQFVKKPVQRMRKNKEFNELESLKLFFNSFYTPTDIDGGGREIAGMSSTSSVYLTFKMTWNETLSLKGYSGTIPSVFSHQIAFMTFSVFLFRFKQALEPFQFHRLLRNTDLLMTTCAQRGEKKGFINFNKTPRGIKMCWRSRSFVGVRMYESERDL